MNLLKQNKYNFYMLNIESFREYCFDKNSVTESFPFNESTLVLKVLNKMFAVTDLEEEFSLTLKAKPEDVISLTETYENITGAYHFNKKHWINIKINGSISDKLVYQLIDNSYNLVVSGMSKKMQSEIKKS